MSLVELLKDVGSGSSKGIINGVMVGVVTNNNDPDGLGRVKVKLPARETEDETHWARVSTLMAGSGRGSFFLPEVNDEVLVAFEQGDIQHPYIIGGLWNGSDKPPETNSDGNNNIRMLRSRSGHVIVFDDDGKSKKEKIIIQTNGGHRITLDDSAGAEKIEITDKTGNNSVRIDSVQNAITIESGMTLSLKSQMIEIEADTMMSIKSGASLTIKGAIVQIN